MKIRFDTLDKKPKVWNIAILSAVTAALLVYLSGWNGKAAAVVVPVYLLITIILLLRALVLQIRYNPYSYNTVYYSGFAVYCTLLFFVHLFILYQTLKYPLEYDGRQVVNYLSASGTTYMLLSFPFLFVFSAALCVSNIVLIRKEGLRFTNLLGVILAFLLIGGVVLLYKYDFYASGSPEEVRRHALVVSFFSTVYLYYECMLLGTIFADALTARYEPDPDRDYMIVLGCGLRKDGTPTPLLKGRIDRAVEFDRKQQELTGKKLTYVTSGGRGEDEVISEGAAMKRYLLEQGIPEERIISEENSKNTFENMKFSKEKILENDPEGKGKIAFSTTNYHVFRSGLFARRNKMRAQGVGAPTKWYFWPNAAVREFVGLLTEHRLKQALIFGGMVALYIILTLIVYR